VEEGERSVDGWWIASGGLGRGVMTFPLFLGSCLIYQAKTSLGMPRLFRRESLNISWLRNYVMLQKSGVLVSELKRIYIFMCGVSEGEISSDKRLTHQQSSQFSKMSTSVPCTVFTGFLGSGKTTIILCMSLICQVTNFYSLDQTTSQRIQDMSAQERIRRSQRSNSICRIADDSRQRTCKGIKY